MTPQQGRLREALIDMVRAQGVPHEALEVGRHTFAVTPTGRTSLNSGRPIFQVYCRTCGVMVHDGTNAPALRVVEHVEGDQ